MTRRTATILILAIVVGIGITLLGARFLVPPYQFHGGLIDPPVAAQDFTLLDQHGQPFHLSDHRGDVVVMFFGYTSCPDVCPATLAHMKSVREQLGDLAADTEFVFLTVDPGRDTRDRLARHLARFDPAFVGLTGGVDELQAVWDDYYVFREIVDEGDRENYLVNHTSRIYAIDREGRLRVTFPFGMEVEHIYEDIRHLVQEG